MMPILDGYGVLHLLNKNPDLTGIPFIFLTAKAERNELRKGMEMGADDYLTKPFDAHELLARLRALLRRVTPAGEQSVISFGSLTIDLASHQACVAGTPVPLTPIEFSLLAQLARHAGRVLTHAHLLTAVWGPKATDQAHYLRVHFAHLRRKLRAAGLAGELIRNEPGIGYRRPLDRD